MMPGWKLRTTRALASGRGPSPGRAARPLLSLMRKVATSLTAASASARSTARRSPVMQMAPGQAVTPGERLVGVRPGR